MYGLDKPPVNSSPDAFAFLEWFDTIRKYVNSRIKINSVTTSETIANLVFYERVDATSGAVTITLPASSTVPGRQVLVVKVDAGANAVTVAPTGADTIQGSATISLAAQWSKALLISNGNNGWERLI